jgi:hypothetical protein
MPVSLGADGKCGSLRRTEAIAGAPQHAKGRWPLICKA